MAVRRCYENFRHLFIEHQSGKEYVERQSKLRKYRSRRERVSSTSLYLLLMSIIQKFQRRFSVTTAAEKDKYWQYLSLAYVTEESDDLDNPNGLIEHKLPWRSESK